jgi:uncharacterized protein (UPF0297 family)
MSAIQRKCVRAQYFVDDYFQIPKNIDLENKSQVISWGIKWNVLHIELASGDMLKIDGWIDSPCNFDWKRPDIVDIEDDNITSYDDDEEDIPIAPVIIKTWSECGETMKKYLEDKKGDAEQRGLVFQIYNELTAQHYNEMKKICDLLFSINKDYYSEDFDVPADMKEKIFDIGVELHNKGGKYIQQLCFYLAVNFMSDDKRLKAIECCWNGAGEWKY